MCQATTPAVKPVRVYLKCLDCLSTACVTTNKHKSTWSGAVYQFPELFKRDEQRHNNPWRGPTCAACGGEMELMGEVTRTHYHQMGEKCACDERCTGAAGPSCDCSCSGENHGTGKMVPYCVASGRVEVKATPDALAAVAEFKTLCVEFDRVWDNYYRGVTNQKTQRRLYDSEYRDYMEGQNYRSFYRKAKQAKTHKVRMNKIKALIERMRA